MAVNDTIKSGNAPSQIWRKDTLGNITNLTLSSVDKKTRSNEQEVQLCNYTDVYYNHFIRSSMDFMLATATEREISNCSLSIGDVVITKDSEKNDDIGVPAIIRDNIPNLVCGYHLAILRPLPHKVDGMFLFYALSILETQQQFWGRANGITRFGLRKNDIKNIEIILPSISEQKAIANVLTILDDKIELNRRMNKTLEEMARALFKSWFVDFDPVLAKMDGRWQPGQSLPGLPAELYNLFPDCLVSSELGEIPQSWRVKEIGDITTVVGGTTPSTKQPLFWVGGHHFWATPKDLSSLTTPILLETNRKLTDDGLAKISSGLLPCGTVLMSSRAPIGYLAINEIPTAINQGFIAMLPHEGISNLFLMFWCDIQQPAIIAQANGSTFLEINKRNFRRINIVKPELSVIQAFDNTVRPLYERMKSNEMQNKILGNLRDAMLPKLLSGKIRIPDWKSDDPRSDQ